MIPLFDSLAHPGCRTAARRGAVLTPSALDAAMNASGFSSVCAVSLASCPDCRLEPFMRECAKHPRWVPVAGLDPHAKDLKAHFRKIKSLGFRAVKLHARYSRFDLASPRLAKIFALSYESGLPVFFCTYHHDTVRSLPSGDPLGLLVEALKKSPPAKVVLLHGGDVRVLEYAELARFNPNLLLDLSHTMLKYPGSSVDADVRFLFRHFDERICVGTDAPQFSHRELRRCFDRLCAGLPKEKAMNAGSRNLTRFLGLPERTV